MALFISLMGVYILNKNDEIMSVLPAPILIRKLILPKIETKI